MAAPSTLTWAIATARRPSVGDVGGASLVDHAESPPPQDGTHLYADMGNQWQKQIAAIAAMTPSARFTIDFSAGAPFISSMMCANSALVAGDFTLTDHATGDVTISWAAGTLPTMECEPTGSINANTTSACSFTAVRTSATAIRIRVMVAGVLSDTKFTVQVN